MNGMDISATRVVSLVPAGTALSRYLMVKAAGDQFRRIELAKGFRNTPQVLATLEAEFQTKAAVAPGTTSDATNAAPLAAYGIAGEALTLLRGASIIGQLESRMRRVPFRTKVARETGTGTNGAWVGEGLSTPVAATAFDTLTQEAYKAGTIVVLTQELLKIGDPVAERTVRETVIAGLAAYLDAQFLTNTVTLSATLRPAAITNGATAVVSTGTTAAQMNADLAGLLAAITTPGAGLVWIMRPTTAYRIAATIGGTAAVNVPISLFGIPLVLSSTSPQQITLVDASQILYSDDGNIELDISEQAAIQMDGAPTDPPVAATVVVALFQENLWGVRAMKWLAYLRAQSGAVAYMTVAY
jgi:HK97 family phage major capsid protein